MTLHEYWKVIRHRWILILASVLVAAGFAWLITPASTETTRQVGSYTATATLLIGQGPIDPQAQNLDTVGGASVGRIKLFVTTGEIPKRAAEALQFGGDPAVLAARLTVEEVEQAQAITISTVAPNGDQAADTVNTFAQETVRYFDEGNQGTGNTRLSILQEATPIPNDSRPILTLPAGRLPRTALAALLGLLIGFGIALILDRLDSRLRTRQEVHEALSMPVIAQVPRLKRSERASGRLGVVAEPLGEYANGYRAARTALMHLPGQQVPGDWASQGAADENKEKFQPARVVLVSSAFEAEGKTTSVANLAASFSETGQSVLVLDCDLRSPDTHNHFDVPQGAGISDHLVQGSQGSIQPLVRPTNTNGVYIITAGTRLDHPAALTSRLAPVLEEARKMADVVIVDTAPLLAASDVFDVLPLVDTVILAVRSGRLTELAGQRVAELLGRFQVPVTGAILIGAPARRSEGYGSRYGYGYGDDPKKKEKKASRAKSKLANAELKITSAQSSAQEAHASNSRTRAAQVESPTQQRPTTSRSQNDAHTGVDDVLRP